MQRPRTPEYVQRCDTINHTSGGSQYFANRLGAMEAQVQEMAAQVTNNVHVINEVLLAQRSIKDLLTSFLPSHAHAIQSVRTGMSNDAPLRSNIPSLRNRAPRYPHPSGVAVAGADQVPSPREHQLHIPSPPSWMTADTVPASTAQQANNTPSGECNSASPDVSQTELVGGEAQTPTETEPRSPCTESAQTGPHTTSPVVDSRVSTRSRVGLGTEAVTFEGIGEDTERTKCAPKEKAEAIACSRACWILHPDAGDEIVAEGRAGGSWKCPTQKFGHLCSFGDQMVQVHRLILGNHRLLHSEERNPGFATLKDAIVKPKFSNVYIKWDSRFLIAKPTKKKPPC